MNRKFVTIAVSILSIIGYGVFVFAAAPSGGYTPGATLNPDCAPGDTSPEPCIVQQAWTQNVADGFVYNTTDLIGIGIDDPIFALQIQVPVVGGSTIGVTTYAGSGPDDATFGGTYTGDANCQYLLGVADTSPGNGFSNDRFIWGQSGSGCTDGNNTPTEITPGSPQTLSDGVTITFASGTGHTELIPDPIDEYWTTIAALAAIPTTNPFAVMDPYGDSLFEVHNDGTFKIRDVDYLFPTADAAGILTSDGAGNLTWETATSSGWELDGNVGTNASTDFIGTTDAEDFIIKTNNDQIARFGQIGNVSFGETALASGSGSMAWGLFDPVASGQSATAWGEGTIASGGGATAWGFEAEASNSYATAWGQNTLASSPKATAWGDQTTASGGDATAWGVTTTASGNKATAWGASSTASEDSATAWGSNTNASNNRATAWGEGSVASGVDATAWGLSTTASGQFATAWGSVNIASGVHSTAFGNGAQATGSQSTAFGNASLASGSNSTAWGYFAEATGGISTAFGATTIASGNYSTAWGYETSALSSAETSFGTHTTPYIPTDSTTDRLVVIGNGIIGGGLGTESDAFTILKNGEVGIGIDNFEANSMGDLFQVGDGSTNVIASIDNTGSFNTISDERKKKNIQDLAYGLDTINNLRPVSFDYKRNDAHTIGFLAQQVLPYIPESVGGSDEDGYSMSYSTIIPVTVKAIQELDLKITNIENLATSMNTTFITNIQNWLGDAANGIEKIFAREVHTEQICVKKSDGTEFCVTGDQLEAMSGGNGSTSSVPTPTPTPTPIPGGDIVPDPDPVPIPTPSPDPVPIPDPDPIPETDPVPVI